MTLSYNLAYQEIISLHPTRRQIFAGKPYSTFPNIWEWLLRNSHLHVGPGENSKTKYIPENPNSQYDWGNDAENVSNILYLVLRIIVQSWGLRLISSHCLMKILSTKNCCASYFTVSCVSIKGIFWPTVNPTCAYFKQFKFMCLPLAEDGKL